MYHSKGNNCQLRIHSEMTTVYIPYKHKQNSEQKKIFLPWQYIHLFNSYGCIQRETVAWTTCDWTLLVVAIETDMSVEEVKNISIVTTSM